MAAPRRTSDAQFTLLALFVGITAGAVIMGVAVNAGFEVVLWGLIGAVFLSFVAICFGVAYLLAPEAAKFVSVIGLITVFFAALLPMALVRSREEARRNEVHNGMRKMYLKLQYLDGDPRRQLQDDINECWAQPDFQTVDYRSDDEP